MCVVQQVELHMDHSFSNTRYYCCPMQQRRELRLRDAKYLAQVWAARQIRTLPAGSTTPKPRSHPPSILQGKQMNSSELETPFCHRCPRRTNKSVFIPKAQNTKHSFTSTEIIGY